ncbi:hypothetical protein AAC387_Pa01g4366 [Persea americana]
MMEAMMGNGIQAPAAEEAHVVLEVEVERDLEESIRSKLNRIEYLSGEEGQDQIISIPKVPERLRNIDHENDAYEPRIISIGPYHWGESKLQDMERHKWNYVQAILSRNEKYCLKDYIDKIKALEKRARRCYSENSIRLDHKQFVEMLLFDGCFRVEFLLRLKEKKDELHTMIWMVPQIQYDILLLENQLPFFILELIFDLVTAKEGHSYPSLMHLALNACKMFSVCKERAASLPKSAHHLLHLYYSFLLPDLSRKLSTDSSSRGFEVSPTIEAAAATTTITIEDEEKVSLIPSATVLVEAGIKFEKKEGNIMDVEFHNGVMKIPPLLIDSFTMYQFRNLITFEQLCPHMRPLFTTYVLFLDYLVNTSRDVALLHGEDIIEHMLGSNEDVALLFNKLTRATFRPSRHYLCRMYSEVNSYCKTKRHRWRAALVHNYFNSPWAVLSVVAAIILLGLTLVQTFFSVYGYLRPPI